MDSQLRQVPAASGLSNAHFYERVPLPRCGTCKNNNGCDLRAPTTRSPRFARTRGLPPEVWQAPPPIVQREGANAHRGSAAPDGRARTEGRARRHGPPHPTAPGPVVAAGSGGPRCRTRCERPLQNRLERGGIALRAHPQPIVEVALRPEVFRRDQHALAGPERARKPDGPAGRVTIECHVDPAGPAVGPSSYESLWCFTHSPEGLHRRGRARAGPPTRRGVGSD